MYHGAEKGKKTRTRMRRRRKERNDRLEVTKKEVVNENNNFERVYRLGKEMKVVSRGEERRAGDDER